MKKFSFVFLSIFVIIPSFFFNIPVFSKVLTEDSDKKDISRNKKIIEEYNFQKDFYLIGRGDILFLKVIGAAELSKNLKVLNDGNVTLPLVGVKKLDGLTINGAVSYIEKMLSEELINPKVELNLIQARPIMISIIGEISRPGVYKLNINSSDLPSLITSIEEAGGLSKTADLTNIILNRRLPGDNLTYKKTKLNLKKLIFEGDLTQNPFLFDRDIIKISKAKIIDNEQLEIASTSLSPDSIKVNFLGEINNPGSLNLKANATLIDGILAAGGPKQLRSNYNFVEILRINRNGSAFRKKYRINLSGNYTEKNNPILNNGDSVWIRKNKFALATDTLGFVASPLQDLVSIWTLFKLVD